MQLQKMFFNRSINTGIVCGLLRHYQHRVYVYKK